VTRYPWLVLILLPLIFLTSCSSHSSSDEPTLSQSPSIASSNQPVSESDLGVPLYPNAAVDQNQSFGFQGNSQSDQHVKTASASLTTTDSVDQVKSFYKEKLGDSARIAEHKSPGGKLVDILAIRDDKQVRIQIAPQANGIGSIIVILTQAHQ